MGLVFRTGHQVYMAACTLPSITIRTTSRIGRVSKFSYILCHCYHDGNIFKNGGVSDLFVLSLVFSIVVMYDASGVRLEAGRQAQILNQIVDYFSKRNIPVVITRKEALKELLGHTPVEVFGGLILGILVAYIQFYYVYNGVI